MNDLALKTHPVTRSGPLSREEVQNFHMAVLDVRQMGEADRLTVAAGISEIDLMASAGHAVAREIERRWTIRPITVLCGPGNNGGDGFVVAAHLADIGWPVRVATFGTRELLTGAARHHAEKWHGLVEALTPSVLEHAELVVDALFGAGLSRPLDVTVRTILDEVATRHLPIIAIDVPSGVMGSTGESLGAVDAAVTVTFFRKKPGHLLLPGRMRCGDVVVADVGIDEALLEQIDPDTFENDPRLWIAHLPRARADSDKYSRGHAMICGGYPMTGAARLAARAAARIGAGSTTIVVPEISYPIYAASLTSVMVHSANNADDFDHLIAEQGSSAWLMGTGTGSSDATRKRVLALLKARNPAVLDADALAAFQDDPAALNQAIAGPCVMTPHDGELHRLFDPRGDRLTRARVASRRSGAIVVLKGSDTVISSPDGRTIINANAPPTLATEGAGDVLSGIILGLLAQGMEPFLAAAAGVWLHGAAATEFGPGLIADDLPDLLPGVLRCLFRAR